MKIIARSEAHTQSLKLLMCQLRHGSSISFKYSTILHLLKTHTQVTHTLSHIKSFNVTRHFACLFQLLSFTLSGKVFSRCKPATEAQVLKSITWKYLKMHTGELLHCLPDAQHTALSLSAFQGVCVDIYFTPILIQKQKKMFLWPITSQAARIGERGVKRGERSDALMELHSHKQKNTQALG